MAKRTPATPIPDNKHGTTSGYSYYGCRCTVCKTAYSEYGRNRRFYNPKTLATDSDKHGTVNGYLHYNCRCEPCVEAKRLHDRTRRYKKWQTLHGITYSG